MSCIAPPNTIPRSTTRLSTSSRKKTNRRRKARQRVRSRNAGSFMCLQPARHGGVVARGAIERTVTVNFVALRRLDGENTQKLEALYPRHSRWSPRRNRSTASFVRAAFS